MRLLVSCCVGASLLVGLVAMNSRCSTRQDPLSLQVYDNRTIAKMKNAPIGTLALFIGALGDVPVEWQACRGQTIAVEPGNVLYDDFGFSNGGELRMPTWNSVAIMATADSNYRYGFTYTLRLMGPSEKASPIWQPLMVIVKVE